VANPVFRPLPPAEFAAFHEPGYAKIAWTLRADPISASESVARTETRVATTDRAARAAFRRYWSLVSPGVALIRRVSLRLVKAEAERRVRIAMREHGSIEPPPLDRQSGPSPAGVIEITMASEESHGGPTLSLRS
jgi:hypothetical protein